MPNFWIEFHHRPGGSVEAPDLESAKQIAKWSEEVEVKDGWQIPYPASPVLHQVSGVPAFCYNPRSKCRGKSSCPCNPSCTS